MLYLFLHFDEMASGSDGSTSSSIEDFSGDEEGAVYGLQPYLFEPKAADYPQEHHPDNPPASPDSDPVARLDNRDW